MLRWAYSLGQACLLLTRSGAGAPELQNRVRPACSSGAPAPERFVLRCLQTTAGVSMSSRCAPHQDRAAEIETRRSLLRGHRLHRDRDGAPTGRRKKLRLGGKIETRRSLLPGRHRAHRCSSGSPDPERVRIAWKPMLRAADGFRCFALSV